jgi:lipoprotein-releasing system permease protein
MTAHATVSSTGEPMQQWQTAVRLAMEDPRVAGAAPYVDGEGLIAGNATQNMPAVVRGIVPDQEAHVSVLARKMDQGSVDSLQPGKFNILLGSELAQWLNVRVGDKVNVLTSDVQSTIVGALPQTKRFTVTGIFTVGYNDIDKGMAFVDMQDLQRLKRMGEGVTGVRLMLHDMDQAYDVARDLARRLQEVSPYPYRISDWTSDNANLYQSLKMEKTVMGVLLSLIILMGAFTLVNSQVMLVTDKQADIAILRTLGLTPRGVMQVFMVQGSLIGVIGTVVGVISGIVLTMNLERILELIEHTFHVVLLPSDVYYITGLPYVLNPHEIVVIALVALSMSFLATLYPAWRAARTDPAEALRYE